jgi:hypothetical protein
MHSGGGSLSAVPFVRVLPMILSFPLCDLLCRPLCRIRRFSGAQDPPGNTPLPPWSGAPTGAVRSCSPPPSGCIPAVLQGEDPGIVFRGLFACSGNFHDGAHHRPSPPMDQEGAQIGVSSFGDPQKPVLPSLSCCLGARPRYGAKCPLKKLPEIPSFPFQENFEGLPEPSLSSDPGFPKPRSQTGRPGRLIAFPTT